MSPNQSNSSEAKKSIHLPGQTVRILVVEDDESFRDTMCVVLEAEGYQVRFAENGLIAKTILSLNQEHFDLVISDIKMPEMDGVTLLKFSKATCPKTKFIIITGFSEVLESQDAYSLGADEFLAKPFRAADLVNITEKVLAPAAAKASEKAPEDDEFSFCKIHVDEFTSSSVLPSDIYIRLQGQKFIKVAREGSEIPVSRIQTYKNKKVDFFFVKVNDFNKYTGLTIKLAKLAYNSKAISREQKIKLFRHTSDILLNQIFIDKMDPEKFDEARNVISNTMNVLGNEPDILELLLLMQSHSDAIYSHSLGVAAYACLVARKMGWGSQQTFIKLSMGGLFHDLGLRELPNSLVTKARRLMTSEEVSLFETHPTRSRDLLASMPGFPGDVILIVHQHHENCSETGYPHRLPKNKIHPLAKIIHVVDEFCDRLSAYGTHEPKAPHQALEEMYTYKVADFDPLALRALMEVFQYPVPEPLAKLKATNLL